MIYLLIFDRLGCSCDANDALRSVLQTAIWIWPDQLPNQPVDRGGVPQVAARAQGLAPGHGRGREVDFSPADEDPAWRRVHGAAEAGT